MDAIVYTSNTGTTAQYAKLLSEATGLPAWSLDKAEAVKKGADIIYLGWLMAGVVQGLKKAAKSYNIRAVCGVGMGKSGSQEDDVRKANGLDSTPVFTLQGGFDITKLHGMYKFMMNTMLKTAGKKLAEKPDKTPEEADMLDMMQNGGNRVSAENLEPVLRWYEASR